MTEKGRVLHWLRTVSSGTVAHVIGCNRYVVIDRVISKAAVAVAGMTEEECKAIQTMEDYCALLIKAKGVR